MQKARRRGLFLVLHRRSEEREEESEREMSSNTKKEKKSEERAVDDGGAFFSKHRKKQLRAFRSPSLPSEQHHPSLLARMDLLMSLALNVAGGWSSMTGRGGSGGEGSTSEFSHSTTATNSPLPPPALMLLQRRDAGHLAAPPQPLTATTTSALLPSRSSSSSSRRRTHLQSVPAAAQREGMPPRSPATLLRSRPSSTSLSLDPTSFPPPPSAPLPAEQVERYWRLQRRLAATLLPEVVRLEALCAEIAAAAAAEASCSPSSPSSPSRSHSFSPSSSPRAGLDPHAATRIAALRRRTLVPLLARLRALPVSETEGSESETTTAMTSNPSSSSLPCSPVPTRADLAALRRAAAVLPRYLEQLRVATRGRPRAFDSERLCAAAAA